MSEKCPTCERPVSRPLPAMRTTPWTDDCACSDYSPCLAHQVTGDGPSRPLDDVMRERTHAVHAQRRSRSPLAHGMDAMTRRGLGGRGIAVCERWRGSFANFLADMGERPPGTTIDRRDVNGNYEPGNCRWATKKQQSRNQKSNRIVAHAGRSLTLAP